MTEFVYRSFTQSALDEAYDNTRAVLESAEILKGFEERSAEMAARFPGTMDVTYGSHPREMFDYFPGEPNAGLFVFIHGGYWQMRNKNTFRFLAKGPLSLGMHVASVGYTLAPDVTLTEIVDEVRDALDKVCGYAKGYQANTHKVIISGWSAGAHLATMLLDEPCVSAALAISGIYDLNPIAKSYLNKALNLSNEEILNLSPMRNPCVSKPMAIVVGNDELSELRRQGTEFASLRAEERIPGYFGMLKGCNHFTILSELENPSGSLVKILELLTRYENV